MLSNQSESTTQDHPCEYYKGRITEYALCDAPDGWTRHGSHTYRHPVVTDAEIRIRFIGDASGEIVRVHGDEHVKIGFRLSGDMYADRRELRALRDILLENVHTPKDLPNKFRGIIQFVRGT